MSGSLDRSTWVRIALYVSFCVSAALIVLVAMTRAEDGVDPINGALFAFCLAISAVTVIELNHPIVTKRNGRVVLLLGGMLAQLALIRATDWIEAANHLPLQVGFLLTPFIFAPMVHAVLLGGPAGIFSAVYVSLLGTLLVPDESKTLFMAVSLLSGVTAALTLRKTRRRVQLLRAGFYAGLMAMVLAFIFGVVRLGAGSAEDWRMIGLAAGTALGMGIGTALVVSGLLPVLEGIFLLTTDISWLELSDLNHRLLRRMQIEAPGTFHHSLIVASLSEAAAEAVGANASLCRVCAYFHDVGKLNKPEYFIENQQDGGENPHDALTPTMSALIIVAHVNDGVDLAFKHRLNP
ncbi:MAG: HDIG domain-containing metalloprotein, partial [Verrucomicrobiales bacterium]